MIKVTKQSVKEKKKSACGKWVTTSYLARDSSSGQQVVLESSQLQAGADLSPFTVLHAFLRQASSPCFQRSLCYEAQSSSSLFQAVLEHLPKTLGDLFPDTQSCPWAPQTLLRMFGGLLGALKEAGSKGIPHRQIAWEAIFCQEESFKLGNFYPVTKDSTELYALYSSQKQRYLSPELRSGLENGRIDARLDAHKADIYALGVLFLQILLWTPLDSLDREPENVYEVLRSVSGFRQFHARIGLMLTPDPAQRPGLEELYEVWIGAESSEPQLCSGCKGAILGLGVSRREGRFCSENCYMRTSSQGRANCGKCGVNLKLNSELADRTCRTCKKAQNASLPALPGPAFSPLVPQPPAFQPSPLVPPQPVFQPSPLTPQQTAIQPSPFPQQPAFQPSLIPQQFAFPRSPPQSQAFPAVQHTCVICWKPFPPSGPSPHPNHSSEVVDFCSDACKAIWISTEQEWDFGRSIPDNAQFCMMCAMVPVPGRAIGLPCDPLNHIFCSLSCLSLYQSEQTSKGKPLVCPSCRVPIEAQVCTGCGGSGEMMQLSCGHPYCSRCFAVCTAVRCVRCGPLPRH